MEDVDGLLRGLLFFGAVVWAGHFERFALLGRRFKANGCWLGLWMVYGFEVALFFGVGVVMRVWWWFGRERGSRDVRRVGGRVVTFSGVWEVQGGFRG